MPTTDEDVFTSMQREIQFESHLNDARAYLEAADYDRTLTAAREARRFLAPGAKSTDLDAIVSAAQSARARAEMDRRERDLRIQAERAKAEADRQRAEEERRKRQEQEALAQAQSQARWRSIIGWVIGIVVAICVIGTIVQWLGAGLIAAVIIGLIVIGIFSSD